MAATLNLKELESYILDVMDRWEVPGLCIAIVKDGKTLLTKGYGTREVGKDLPVDDHTLFAISGTTASFTASALALLVAENKMNWTDSMISLLPEFKTGNDLVSNYATVVDALAHRSGVPSEMLSFFPNPHFDRRDILANMKYLESPNHFRSHWAHSFHMVVAAGEIIPALTSISWDDFVQNRLFDPIGMTDSITGPHLFTSNQNIATPHEMETGKVTPVPHGQTSNIGPATSSYSSAADMAKWLTFQLNNGKIGDKVLIPEEEISMMRTSHIPANIDFPGISKNFINHGLGLFISDSSSGHKLYSNGGDSAGMESYHAFLPELDLGIAVMTNSTQVIPQPLIAWIIDRYTNAPRNDWISLSIFDVTAMLSSFEDSRKAITDPTKKPSQSIESYQGLYHHPLIGNLKVKVEAGELFFTLGAIYEGNLLHANNDTFYAKTHTPHIGHFTFNGPAQFRLDQTGNVSSLYAVGKEFQKVE